jgi:NitT/TauT family transport system permease protein
MTNRTFPKRVWGAATGLLYRTRKLDWIDLLIVVALAGVLYGVVDLAQEWTGVHRPTVEINLSPWALPGYTFFSLMRGLLAYCISLSFTLLYGYWAAKDKSAERVLIPLLDILQSIPVLGFMPGLILALVAIFPHSNIGLELAAVIMIFTGQAWNMTFSFYHSLQSVPNDMREVATVYRFSWWQRLRELELPYSTIGLVWNSMMSMAGGWFFLMITEAFTLGDQDFRLPGLGSYMSVAVDAERIDAMIWAIVAMVVMIVTLDQLLWRPVTVWSQKFRVEEGGQQEAMTSWFLDLLQRSRLITRLREGVARWKNIRKESSHRKRAITDESAATAHAAGGANKLSLILLMALWFLLAYCAWRLLLLLRSVELSQWGRLMGDALLTLLRVIVSTMLGTLWALPAGLAIGLSPRLSRVMQPVVQVVASFPAPMLFPLVIAFLQWAGVSLGWGSILLMLLGTQWYILFNVIAGAMAIPADLKEAARSYRIGRWQLFRILYFPAVFPYLVTGWVTAAGGAWNASIVSEYVRFKQETIQATGVGAQISAAAKANNFPLLAASVLVMSILVVTFNRTVWKRCYQLAETRFSLNK